MNIENINKLIDHLESIPEVEYNQKWYTHGCGTPACIAGHAAYLSTNKTFRRMNKFLVGTEIRTMNKFLAGTEIGVLAKKWLDIPLYKSNGMFEAFPIGTDEEITKQDAINMLKNLIETGEVVWRKENEC